MANAQGHVTLEIGQDVYQIRFGFEEIADADEYLGRSILGALDAEPMNFHLLRVAFYFATREHSKDVRSVKQAGKILAGADLGEFGQAIRDALEVAGLAGDDSGEA